MTRTGRRWWPQTLTARLMLILAVGLVAGQLLTALLVLAERGLAMRGMMATYLGSDVATAVAVLERLPAAERPAWLPRLDKRNYRFILADAPSGEPVDSTLAAALGEAVSAALQPPRPVQVRSGTAPGDMWLAVTLADKAPLSVLVRLPPLQVSPWALAALVGQFALLAALGAWALRQATRPLALLADAADALDPARMTSAGPDLPVTGPSEVARAAAAFNGMQQRIRAHLDERVRILAAVSHDLQTPITRLRLRADLMDDALLRERLQADLAEMQALVEEGLSYARTAQAVQEPAQRLDLRALLDSIALDYSDSGRDVVLLPGEPGHCTTRPQALRRLVCNLVDNALKFAGAAQINLSRQTPGGWRLQVLDRGPGIPAEALEAVKQPFYRLEGSRNRETGGSGLGLAIADQLASALGGRLLLAQREGGGLDARVNLPDSAP